MLLTHHRLTACRACGSPGLRQRLDLGVLSSAGSFPRPGEAAPEGPLTVIECERCLLAQLGHIYEPGELFTPAYGYRSGLNTQMVRHLGDVADLVVAATHPGRGDLLLDVGANDGTLLRALARIAPESDLLGVDPLAAGLQAGWPEHARVEARLFDPSLLEKYPTAKAITCLAMAYDVPDPAAFLAGLGLMLAPGGLLLMEVAYMHRLLHDGVFDTICHEHAE